MAYPRYNQYCALARALDVVGDRWTLLIVRELKPGPRRFTDLIDGLPGIPRKVLTERLRGLARDGVIARQELPPPAARWVYALTDNGLVLAEAMGGLVAWGAGRLGELEPTESFRPRWTAVAMAALADREAAKGVSETYQYLIGRSAFHFVVADGSIRVRDGLAEDPAVVLTTNEDTWADLAAGKIEGAAATATGALTLVGDPRAAKRLEKIFSRRQLLGPADVTTSTDPGLEGHP